MNERIQELAKQAVLDSLFESIDPAFTVGTGNGKMTIPLVFAEKFAELIVRECAKVLTQHGAYFSGDGEPYHYAASLIEEHFGVEE